MTWLAAHWHLIDWEAVTALGTVVLALATILLAGGVILEFGRYRGEKRTAETNQRHQFYTQLDSVYYDIQRQIIVRPHLASPAGEKTADEAVQYDAFAFMVWNFIEAIYDYGESDAALKETWGVIMVYEATLHRAWFEDPRNHLKFKDRFRRHIRATVLA